MAQQRPWQIVMTSPGQNFDIEEAAVRAAGGEAEFRVVPCSTADDLIAVGCEADGIIAGNESYTRRVLEGCDRVKVISRPAVGFDQVDIAAAAELGIVVTHVPDYCTDEVSDHALSLLLALHRRIPWLNAAIMAGGWAQAPVYGGDRPASFHAGEVPGPSRQLRGQTLGIIGFGRIGQRVAEKARGFGLRLLAHDPYLPADAGASFDVTMTTLDQLLAEADLVTVHCLLNAETKGLLGAAQFAAMKPTAMLVNTARGPIVDPNALVVALREGHIAAAALDVTDPEPPGLDSPLLQLPNLLLTPHSAYYSDRSRAEVRRRGIEHALAVLRNERPAFVANPQVFELGRLRAGVRT
ncbi:MAG TPA: C-terminal binding protein [Thermomicrobiales bacterium]|jgi:D-3-phosphoglycerate dehydrogenase